MGVRRWLWVVALLPALAHGAVYRVDGAAGDDAADGMGRPFRTLARGLQALQPGDTLQIVPMDGPYRESMPLRTHGTAAAPIVIDGGGATISGADPAPKTGWTAAGEVFSVAQPAEVKFLFGPDTRYEQGKSATALAPEQWFWGDGKLFFRPAVGKTPAGYDLEMSVRISGVLTSGAGQIIVRNLTAIHFYNDGFNIHNGSGPLWFENIRGLWNGDEGFSAHENCECYVRGGEFSNNYWHGICDIDFARTHYQSIVCRDNRSKGIWFFGGMHSVTDAEVSGSPQQVVLSPTQRAEFPRLAEHPLNPSLTNLRSVVIRSQPGEVGVQVMGRAAGVLEHCLVDGGTLGVRVEPGGRAFVVNSIVTGASEAEVSAAGEYFADHNLYFPGRLLIAGATYGPEQFAAYQAASGNDAGSWVEEPVFIGDSSWVSRASHALGAAFGPRLFGGPDLGPEQREARPEEPGVAPAGAKVIAGGEVYTHDFEQHHPWALVYPVPEANADGAKVIYAAELSDEQAHGGAKSAKWQVTLPPGPPAAYNLKLFTQKFEYRWPVTAVKLWLYGDGSGRTFRLRVRDATGESFYGPAETLDWTGWREVAWDLAATPPVNIIAGDGNLSQDVPPLELVLEVDAAAGSTLTLYADDLEITTGDGSGTPGAGAARPAPAPTPAATPGAGALPALPVPAADLPAPAPSSTDTADGRTLLRYDFEQANPWSRPYGDPSDTNQAGEGLRGRVELSDEQAHGGARSAKVEIQFPAPPPTLRLKLFSAKLPFDQPVRALRFWLYGDGSGRSLIVRLRDRSGESFYRTTQSIDWTGWREVAWDLTADPPATIAGGDGNQTVDGPPVELVLELGRAPGDEGRVLLYLDDLEVGVGR